MACMFLQRLLWQLEIQLSVYVTNIALAVDKSGVAYFFGFIKLK